MSMDNEHHRINAEGTAVECLSDELSNCRTRPKCDCETWPCGHTIYHGQECWKVAHINATSLEDSYDATPSAEPYEVVPLGTVDIDWLGLDDGCSWSYAADV